MNESLWKGAKFRMLGLLGIYGFWAVRVGALGLFIGSLDSRTGGTP